MPFFQDAAGIMNAWWCACQLTGPYPSHLPTIPAAIDTRYRQAGDRPTRRQCRAVAAMQTSQLEGLFGLDASHRAKENRTHPTHWPAADGQDFPRVRSGGAGVARSIPRAIPGLTTDARRMRAGDAV